MDIRFCFILLLLTSFLTARGQETLEKKGKLNDYYEERYHVLKSDKKVKHGPYQVFSGDSLIVAGMYDHGKKIGRWNFYSGRGSMTQRYNFSSSTLEYFKPDTNFMQFRIELPAEARRYS